MMVHVKIQKKLLVKVRCAMLFDPLSVVAPNPLTFSFHLNL